MAAKRRFKRFKAITTMLSLVIYRELASFCFELLECVDLTRTKNCISDPHHESTERVFHKPNCQCDSVCSSCTYGDCPILHHNWNRHRVLLEA